jgi:hypothetical protein
VKVIQVLGVSEEEEKVEEKVEDEDQVDKAVVKDVHMEDSLSAAPH